MLNQVVKVSSRTYQQFVEDASKLVTFLDYQISQGSTSVATYYRLGRNISNIYTHNFLNESTGERILKIGPHLPKLLSHINCGLLFWDTV